MFENFEVKDGVYRDDLYEKLKEIYRTIDAMHEGLNSVTGLFTKCCPDTAESLALAAAESMVDAVKEVVYREICSVSNVDETLPEMTFAPDFSPALTQSELQAKCDELFNFDREDGNL